MDVDLREFQEETGQQITVKKFIELTPVHLKSGKTVYAWACEEDIDVDSIKSNPFSLEWPQKSGRFADYPEIDRAAWFDVEKALQKINLAQKSFIEELLLKIAWPEWCNYTASSTHADFMNLIGYNDTYEDNTTLFSYCPMTPSETNSRPFKYSYIQNFLTVKQNVSSSQHNYGLTSWDDEWGG